MSLLTIAKNVAINVGVSIPSELLSSQEPDAIKIVRFTEEAGEEIARRTNWGALRKTATVTGGGLPDPLSLPVDFSRVTPGISIKSNGSVVRTGLTADEWNSLPASIGDPRFALLRGASVSFWPYLPVAQTAILTYQSLNWCSGGATWTADSDVSFFPQILIEKGALWRWRRNIGQDYQDQMAEFESALVEMAGFDDAMRQP